MSAGQFRRAVKRAQRNQRQHPYVPRTSTPVRQSNVRVQQAPRPIQITSGMQVVQPVTYEPEG